MNRPDLYREYFASHALAEQGAGFVFPLVDSFALRTRCAVIREMLLADEFKAFSPPEYEFEWVWRTSP